MKLSNYVDSLDLQMHESYRGDCPFCNGKNTFTAVKTNNKILYNCYKVSCEIRGNDSFTFTVNDAIKSRNAVYKKQEIFILPDHIVPNRKQVSEWANAYELVANDIGLLYDVKEYRVVFPVKHDGLIVDATGRALRKRHIPKWKRYGSSGHAYTQGNGNIAVVVEDCISAAVVPTIDSSCTGFALMGTALLPTHTIELQKYNQIIVALDPDAVQKTFVFTRQLRGLLPHMRVYALKLEDDLKYRKENDIVGLRECVMDNSFNRRTKWN
jgi:hypothetical protein